MRPPTIATFIEGEGEIKKHIGHLYYTQEVLNQIMLLTSYMKR